MFSEKGGKLEFILIRKLQHLLKVILVSVSQSETAVLYIGVTKHYLHQKYTCLIKNKYVE